MKFSILAFFVLSASFAVQASPVLTVGDAKVRAGGKTTIPISFENDGSAVGLQFDVFLPIGEIEQVDVNKCFAGRFKRYAIAGCRQQDAPNQDVVRYLIVTDDLSPLPSGRLANLVVHVGKNAFSGRYPISVADSTAKIVTADRSEVALTTVTSDMEISGGRSPDSRRPSIEPVLFGSGTFDGAGARALSRSSHQIDTDMEVLADNPHTLQILLPNSEIIRVERRGFDGIRGFVARIGTNEPLKDPSMLAGERKYFWYGGGDESDVRFTVHAGYVNGSVSTPNQSYVVDGPLNAVKITEVDTKILPPLDDGIPVRVEQKAIGASGFRKAAAGDPVVLDVLVLYTPQARTDAGGQGAIDALAQASINSLNSATSDSDIGSVTFQLVETQVLNGFTPSGITSTAGRADLRALRLNNAVRAARDSAVADIVIVLLRDVVDAQGTLQLSSCGVAFVQRQVCFADVPSCSVGTAFEDFAYGWVSVQCATLPTRFSFAHETGHLLGAEHQRAPACWASGGSCISVPPADASFEFSYAAFLEFPEEDAFTTLMGAFNDGPPQFVQFSNPQVDINSQASGVTGETDNATTILSLAPIVSEFRAQLVFSDGFETSN